MTDSSRGYQQFFAELKRRRVFRVMAVYGVVGFGIIEAAGAIFPRVALPDWTVTFVVWLILLGFPVAVVLAWAFDLTPEGVQRTTDASPAEISAILAQPASRRWPAGLLALAGVALLFGGGWWMGQRSSSFAPQEAVAEVADPGIAFLPFVVSGSGLEHLREGMVTLLFTSLDGAAGLRAISDRTVLAQWDRLVGPGQRTDFETEMQVAAATGASYALLGSVVEVGPRLQLSGDVYEVPAGTSLGRVSAEGSADSLASLVEDFAIEALQALAQAGVETLPRADLRGVTTHSLPALTAYLEGEAYFRRGDFDAAIPRFVTALALDSTFALAHFRIGLAYVWGRGSSEQRTHMLTAIEGNLTSRRRLIARAAILAPGLQDDLEELVRRHPDDAEAWWVLGDWYMHRSSAEDSDPFELARVAFTQASDLDPGFAPYLIHLLDFAFAAHDTAEASRLVEHYGRASPGSASYQTYRITHSLIFEPTMNSLAFDAAIDTLVQVAMPNRLYDQLGNPRGSRIGIAAELLRAKQSGELRTSICWRFALAEGRWHDFLAYATDPRLEPGGSHTCLFQAYIRDYPIPEELLDETMSRASPGSSCPECWPGAYAASKGRWEEYERWLAALRNQTDRPELIPILEGYGQWKAGDIEQGRQTLESATQSWPPVRWWLGQISLELGQPDAAVRYFSSFFPDGMSWTRSLYYLGLAYEDMGEVAKAQEAYAEYLDIWRNADPELEPLKQQARDALVRLGPLDQ